jgi:hypothetical protein
MFLGTYRFEGPATTLVPAYEQLLAGIPAQGLHLHTCVVDDGGIWIYDCCPTREVFKSFANSPAFLEAIKTAGLPIPRVTPVGEVHRAFVTGKQVI